MFDVSRDLGVQSWCFREFVPLDQLIAQVKNIGLKRVEVCAKHIDFNHPAGFDAIIKTFREAGVQITSIGVQYFKGDPSEEKWFDFAQRAGCSMISCSYPIDKVPETYRSTEKWAEKYNLVLGIHNHGGHHWLGNETTLAHVLKNTSPRIGLCIDTAWCLAAAQDPLGWAQRYGDRLFGVHLKDFTFLPTGKDVDVVVGTGNLKLPEFMALIAQAPHCKAVTLEYEGDRFDPAPKLKECIEKIRAATQA